MPRVYRTKPRNELRTQHPSVPMTEAMLAALRKKAAAERTTVAEVIRAFIQQGLEKAEAVGEVG